jgi:hypothetical protein
MSIERMKVWQKDQFGHFTLGVSNFTLEERGVRFIITQNSRDLYAFYFFFYK